MVKPKMVCEREEFGEYDLDFDSLVSLVEKYSKLDSPQFDAYSYYDDVKIVFSGYRPENDKERAKRLADAKKEKLRKQEAKDEIEKQEKIQLKHLLDKYGPCCGEDLFNVES